MARGGKKKDKKKAAEPTAETASESQPSTSQVVPPITEEEGLTRGSEAKSKDSLKGDGDGTPSAPAFAPSKEPSSAKEVKEKDEEEGDGLGLGLGGGKKKRRPRKKKEGTPEASTAASDVQTGTIATTPVLQAPLPQAPLPTKLPSTPAPQSTPSAQQPPAPWSHGPTSTPQWHGPTSAPQWHGPTSAPQWHGPTSAPQWHGPSVIPPGSVQAASRPVPAQTLPVQSAPGRQQPPESRGPADPRGQRGKDAKHPPQGQIRPQQPFPTMAPIAASIPPVQPSQTQTSQAVAGKKTADISKICRYKIPTKIPSTTKTVSYVPVQLFCNYFKMDIQPLTLHRYDISFKPDRPKKLIPKAFETLRNNFFRNCFMAFDQVKNCYTKVALPKCGENQRLLENVQIVDDQGKTLKFEVTIIHTGIINLGTLNDYMRGGTSLNPPTEAIQAIDVILRQGTLQSYVKAGRQFFKRPARPIDLGDGLEMWTGLFQSAIFTSRPFINIDVAHKGFPKNKKLTTLLSEDFRLNLDAPIDSQRNRGVENFLEFIKGLRVVAPIFGDNPSAPPQKRDFIINQMREIPSKIRFDHTDPNTGQKTNMSVADYFTKIKRVRLQYPNLNCMWVGPRDKNICYPMEFLEVAYGQPRNKQLNERQLSTMVRSAAAPPDERKCKIQEISRDMNYAQNPYFREFGLTIDTQFYTVSGKILEPPVLDCGEGRPTRPRQGAWNSRRLLKAMPLPNWGFVGVEMDPRSCNYEKIVDLLKDVGGQLGLQVANPQLSQFNVRPNMLAGVFREALNKGITFLFLVISGRLRDGYHRIKQAAECEVGIVTQCVRDQTAERRMNFMTMRNILLKVNSKLMGVNQALATQSIPRCIKTGNVMIVGADVTHPSPDQKTLPSIAAVTASIDQKSYVYNLEMSVQTPKVEIIDNFEEIMVEHLKVYKQTQKRLPDKIYYYRDGVSEGQFAQVLNSELTAIYNAHQRMTGTNFKPEVLFLLVQKRHHTRLFVQDKKSNKAYNVEPGTLVDVDIVHPTEIDFYLVSHEAIKGTARPSRYHVVCNDGSIPYEEIEQLTYYLCHLFSRCPRSVSYPTPTYYAHLACLRARSLTYGMTFNNDELEVRPKRIGVKANLLALSRMFFV